MVFYAITLPGGKSVIVCPKLQKFTRLVFKLIDGHLCIGWGKLNNVIKKQTRRFLMRLINLESHLFSNSLLSIQAKDLNDFIPSFLPLQIYPQEFNEAMPNGELKKQFMFINPMDGKQILFQDNKISFILSFGDNRLTPENLEEEHNKFLDFIDGILSRVENIRPDNSFNRLSYVVRYADIEEFDNELQRIKENTLSTLSWVNVDKKPTDLNIHYGFREQLEGELINNLAKITLGFFQTFTPGGAMKQDCFIKEIDINTIDENRDNRFTYSTAKQLIRQLKVISHQRIIALNSK
ncbi:hypothetical protein NL467_22490 [Klebsiella pneumoniae]|nr:hypothetical protein [Klebsiella pneumoniae]